MAINNSYNFRAISDLLTTSGVVGGNRLKGLAAEGYGLVINLLPDDNQYAVAGEQEIIESQGVEYIYIPVDFECPTKGDFQQFVTAMTAAKQYKTHVHCAANWRVSGFWGVYAEQQGIWSRSQADEFIAGLWQPDHFPAWQALLAILRQ